MPAPLAPPLTDGQLAKIEAWANANPGWTDVRGLVADARWHRAELAKARAENERLRGALKVVQPLIDSLDDGHGRADEIIDARETIRAALAPEAPPELFGDSEQLPGAGKDEPK